MWRVLSSLIHSTNTPTHTRTKTRHEEGTPASSCHDNPSLGLSHPSFPRSPRSRDPLPPIPRGCLFPPAVSLPPRLASKAFFGFLGASLVAKRQQSVPLLLTRILHSSVAGEEAMHTEWVRSPYPRKSPFACPMPACYSSHSPGSSSWGQKSGSGGRGTERARKGFKVTEQTRKRDLVQLGWGLA